jgi:hypothetical protein
MNAIKRKCCSLALEKKKLVLEARDYGYNNEERYSRAVQDFQ